MNRGERRRRERAAAKQPVLMVGDGIAAIELTGSRFEAKPHADLAPKIEGQHRWVATAAYVLTLEQAAVAHDPDTMKFLDHENLMHLAIGCWDCERPLGDIAVDSICEGEPNQ